MVDPEDHLSLEGQVSGHYPMYVIVGSANYTGAELPPQMNLSLDLDKPFLKLYAVHGKGIHIHHSYLFVLSIPHDFAFVTIVHTQSYLSLDLKCRGNDEMFIHMCV